MVLDTTCNNKTLSWGDVFHDELLDQSSIDVSDIVFHTESWHTEGVETISSSQEHFLLRGKWIELGQVIEESV